MIRRLLTILMLVLLALAGCDKEPARKPVEPADAKLVEKPDEDAEDEPAEEEAQADAPLIERPLLWKIDGPNGPLYLFGTIHGGIEGLSWDDFPAEAHLALDQAEVVVLEANLADVNQQEMAKRTMLPTSKSLKEMLGDEAFSTLVEETGRNAMVLDLLQPWAAYSELSRKLVGKGQPVDKMVESKAKAGGKEIAYLESVKEQIGLLQDAVTASLLSDMLKDLERQKEALDAMIAAYRAGNAEALAEAAFDPKEVEKHPELYEALFDKRNKAWVTELEKLIERGNVFVAVGAGHLVGDSSVNAMLEEKGYEVERVAPSAGE